MASKGEAGASSIERSEEPPSFLISQAAAAAQSANLDASDESHPTARYATPQESTYRLTDAGPAPEDAALRHEDFIHDPPDEHVPPPAYGDHYGSIHNEQDGFGTNARVAAPALRNQLDLVTDQDVPPPPYIPPSLGGAPGQKLPPALNVVIHVVGSRGDVQPFVALGKVLKETYGHRVRLATHPVFHEFVTQNGLEFFNISGDPAELMAFMVKNPGLMPGFDTLRSGDVGKRRRGIADMLKGCWRSCIEAGNGMGVDTISLIEGNQAPDATPEPDAQPFIADAIIANPPSFAHIHCAEKLGIPLHMMFTMPWSPTQAFPHPLANIQTSNADPHISNFMSYALVDMMTWQGLGDVINRFRHNSLGLEPISLMWGPGMLARLRIPWTYCWSAALIPKPKDWAGNIFISGFYFLNLATNYDPPSDLREFLEAGPPPVYIGFGSIVVEDPNAMTKLIFEAVQKTGQRALVSKGWGGFGADEFGIPEGVFMLGNVPHDWLFKHVSCVVHHGGAGTTAAGIAAGRPTVVVPFFGDQPFWGNMVNRGGAGPPPIPNKQLTAEKLADAILEALKPSSLEKAAELAATVNAEKGTDNGAVSFHQMLDVDKLRCHLCPDRGAVWRIRRTEVRLSTLAATTLSNAGLLKFNDLKLYRPREYVTEDGPWDPITGGATALIGTMSSMMMGVADFPIETLKALRIHPDSKSKASSSSSTKAPSSKAPTQPTESANASVSGRQSEETDDRDGEVRSPTIVSSPTLETTTSRETVQSPMSSFTNLTPVSSQDNHRKLLGTALGDNQERSRPSSGSSSPSRHGPSDRQSSDHSSRNHSRGRSVDPTEKLDTIVHTGKGVSRIVGAGIKSPMDFSMNIARGFHNAPKLYGDTTVREHGKITDLQSGLKAAGKEFGYGLYDGITGLVTQPISGAKKEGAAGFLKGVGKGIGGIMLKPSAGAFALPGYTFKGIYQELQKFTGSNSQNYIIAARVTQGHEDWQRASATDKQDIIRKWKAVSTDLKKKKNPGEDQLESMHNFMSEHRQRKKSWQDRRRAKKSGSISQLRTDEASQSSSSLPEPGGTSEVPLPPPSFVELPGASARPPAYEDVKSSRVHDSAYDQDDEAEHAELEEAIRKSVAETSRGDPEQDEMIERAIRASIAELERVETEDADDHEDAMKRAMHASLGEAQRYSESHHLADPDVTEEDLEEAMRRSMLESHPPHYNNGDSAIDREYEQAEEDELQKAIDASKAEHDDHENEITRQKTEEDIVMEYIKKQSLAEEEHRQAMIAKGKAKVVDDNNDSGDEDLKRAIAMSMHREGEEGESSHT
ncbi:MAG: hypothetical protein M1820_005844 [Bogoriella megaspora]|nr:MAG: hypothetical protein M1820_005844 [Bogoriella megaspora]